jgi:tetratricopeptide (TPR) repeat protein
MTMQLQHWLIAGHNYLDRHMPLNAMESFRRVLATDPDHAEAHASLAIALVQLKRLHAADLEASRALLADPEYAPAHVAKAWVHWGARRWPEAREEMARALQLEPLSGAMLISAAQLHFAVDDFTLAEKYAREGLAVTPDSCAAEVLLGELARRARDFPRAQAHALNALTLEPDDLRALTLRGWLYLDEGKLEEAREHARWALSEAPADPGAIRLLVAIKARESFILGLWWRFNSALMTGSSARAIAILLAMYVVKALVAQLSVDFGFALAADVVDVVWMAFCGLTWVGPMMFGRMLDAELASVSLRDDY